MAAVLSPYACVSGQCAKTFTAPYRGTDGSVPIPLALSTTTAVPVSPVPYTVYLPKCGACMVKFSGFLVTGEVTANLPADVPMYLSYVNTAVPSVVMEQAVPVFTTLPDAAGVAIPVTLSQALNLPAGTYAFTVNVGPFVGAAPLTLGVAGTLNISWIK